MTIAPATDDEPRIKYADLGKLGHHGQILALRAELRKESIDRFDLMRRGPGLIPRTKAISLVTGRNSLIFMNAAGASSALISAMPRSRSSLLYYASRYRRYGIDGLVDQKKGRVGRKRNTMAPAIVGDETAA